MSEHAPQSEKTLPNLQTPQSEGGEDVQLLTSVQGGKKTAHTPHEIKQMQRMVGNRATLQLLRSASESTAPRINRKAREEGADETEQEETKEKTSPKSGPSFSDGPPTDKPQGSGGGTGSTAGSNSGGNTPNPNSGGTGSNADTGGNTNGGPGIKLTEVNGSGTNAAPRGSDEAQPNTTANGPDVVSSEGGTPTTNPDSVPLHMPPPPADISPKDAKRLNETGARAGATATAQGTLTPSQETVVDARDASKEPQKEADAKAKAKLAAELSAQAKPSLEIEQLCERIYQVIRDKRPPSEDDLGQADPKEMARAAGDQLDSSIQSEANKVEGSYDKLQNDPKGTPQKQADPLNPPPTAEAKPDINAAGAVPTPVPASAVSLDKDKEAADKKVTDVEKEWPASKEIEGGPLGDARTAQNDLALVAKQDPAQVLSRQQGILATASSDMAALQSQALQALLEARSKSATGVQGQQTKMVGTEEQMRERVGLQADEIYKSAQTQVETLMKDVPTKAMQKWQAGVDTFSVQFKQRLNKVQKWIDDRHSDDIGGAITEVWDSVTGLPDWITDEYDGAEKQFGDSVCGLLRQISREVNGIVAASQAIIKQSREDIGKLYDALPANLQSWAAEEKGKFDQKLNQLSNSVNSTRDNFNKDLKKAAAGAVQDVRQEIHGLREKAKGLIGRIADAINAFLEDPIRFIINGLLELVGIPPEAFWAVVAKIQGSAQAIAKDPMKFANNLVNALKTGFQKFFDNAGTHLLDGLLQWLFSGLGKMGIQAPKDFSLESVVTFFMQMLGITWQRIRKMIAKRVGEGNVRMIEKAWGLLQKFITQGPAGIFKMLEEKINPQQILDMVLKTAVDFVVETLIKNVAMRIIGMLNPAGAIAQAIEVIYKVLKWVFDNAAKLFNLVETVVNGIGNLIAGNIGGMANAIESALARVLPVVIDFFADLLGLGDLPKKVSDAVKGVQQMVETGLDAIIGWVASQAKSLLEAMGLMDAPEDPNNPKKPGQQTAQGPVDNRMGLVAEAIGGAESQYSSGMTEENALGVASTARQRVPDANKIDVRRGKDSWEYDITLIQRATVADANTVDGGPPIAIPEKRYLPAGFETRKLYEWSAANYASWGTIRKNFVSRAMTDIKSRLDRMSAMMKDPTADDKEPDRIAFHLVREGLISDSINGQPTNAKTLTAFYDAQGMTGIKAEMKYAVDHVRPLAHHWMEEGFDSGDTSRKAIACEDANLQLLVGSVNSSLGSYHGERVQEADGTFTVIESKSQYAQKPYVGRNFTSTHAQSDRPDATKIRGESFTDKDGKPL